MQFEDKCGGIVLPGRLKGPGSCGETGDCQDAAGILLRCGSSNVDRSRGIHDNGRRHGAGVIKRGLHQESRVGEFAGGVQFECEWFDATYVASGSRAERRRAESACSGWEI